MKRLILNKDDTIYTNESNIIYDINESINVVIYNYNIDESCNIVINLNKDNSKIEYHYSTVNVGNNTFKIIVNHNKCNTTSNIYNHGVNVLNNSLTFDVSGKVPNSSSNCIVNQENEIINLSNGKGCINPNLIIENYDVSSSHSAYIGQFNKDKLFYLMSRGITEEDSINMLVNNLIINGGSIDNEVLNKYLKEVSSLWTKIQEEK